MYYSRHTLSVLLLMVVTGAARSLTVKLFFQSGLEKPIFVVLLYLFGQSLSLLLWWLLEQWSWALDSHEEELEDEDFPGGILEPEEDDIEAVNDLDIGAWVKDVKKAHQEQENHHHNDDPSQEQPAPSRTHQRGSTASTTRSSLRSSSQGSAKRSSLRSSLSSQRNRGSIRHRGSIQSVRQSIHVLSRASMRLNSDYLWDDDESEHIHSLTDEPTNKSTGSVPSQEVSTRITSDNRGSVTGLTEESRRAISFVQDLPFWQKILIPSIFNLINAVCRWASLLFVQASIYEILIGGLDLILSVLAARFFRKRQVSMNRWIAVIIVALGVALVGWAGTKESGGDKEDNTDNTDSNGPLIGYSLIVGKCVTSVFQDISEEVFLQTSDIPVLQLLGWEGLFGIAIASVFYFPLAASGLIPNESFSELGHELGKWQVTLFAAGIVLLFTVAGIYNILATAETSAVTRNLWKNFRTVLVWAFGLILYYSTPGSVEIGEAWKIPASFVVLGGFGIMLFGTHVYYKPAKVAESSEDIGSESTKDSSEKEEDARIPPKRNSNPLSTTGSSSSRIQNENEAAEAASVGNEVLSDSKNKTQMDVEEP